MARKLKSGIVGQAQVIFGGAIGMNLGWVKSARGEELAIGMAELKHPAAKAGDPIIDEETYNGTQVTLVFPDFGALNNFRYILDLLEAELKKRIAERDAQQKIDFDDAAPSHLVHEHIDPPTFEEAKCEQKPTDEYEWSGKIKSRKVKGVLKEMLDEKLKSAWSEEDEEILEDIRFYFELNKEKMTDALIARHERFFNKIKSLKPQQKQEWSEEDKNAIQVLKDIVKHSNEINENIYTIPLKEKLYDWLKSLKDRYTWKPSEEQMDALLVKIPIENSCNKVDNILKTLYSDLKKLK